eukprot:1120232-Amphidinium_carterae.1
MLLSCAVHLPALEQHMRPRGHTLKERCGQIGKWREALSVNTLVRRCKWLSHSDGHKEYDIPQICQQKLMVHSSCCFFAR